MEIIQNIILVHIASHNSFALFLRFFYYFGVENRNNNLRFIAEKYYKSSKILSEIVKRTANVMNILKIILDCPCSPIYYYSPISKNFSHCFFALVKVNLFHPYFHTFHAELHKFIKKVTLAFISHVTAAHIKMLVFYPNLSSLLLLLFFRVNS